MEVRKVGIHGEFVLGSIVIGTMFAGGPIVLREYIGDVVAAIASVTVIAAMVAIIFMRARTCRCPKCGAILKRDRKLSADQKWQYTCTSCQIAWESVFGGESD